jgi:hypothetical protein
VITPAIFVSIPYTKIGMETGIQNEAEIGINILIDSVEIDIPHIIKYVRRFNYNYIVSLPGTLLNNPKIDILLPKFYMAFTLSGCLNKINNSIIIFSKEPVDQLLNLGMVKDYFRLQGEESIDFVIVEPDDITQVKNETLFSTQSQLLMLNELQFEEYNTKKPCQIILSFNNLVRMEEEIALIKDLVKNNKYVKLFFEIITLRLYNVFLERQLKLWKERSNLYFSFISLSKIIGENEYYSIIKWYEKEYEILPIWYKRFGHIIKVLMGKRKFGSLFSDYDK